MKYYDKFGNLCSDGMVAKHKTIIDDRSKRNSVKEYFYVLHNAYGMYDPLNEDNRKSMEVRQSWQTVTKSQFELYLKYLQTRQQRFYNQAKRI